jgi:hypothetical protein
MSSMAPRSSEPPSVRVESGRAVIGPETRILLTPQNLVTLIGMLFAAVVAWNKIPDSEEVQRIATQSINQVSSAFEQRNAEIERRTQLLENQVAGTNAELNKLNKRMDYLIIIMAGSAADSMQRSSKARNTAERVKRNLELGDEPLDGVSWGPK